MRSAAFFDLGYIIYQPEKENAADAKIGKNKSKNARNVFH
jgi:hypothetical protein